MEPVNVVTLVGLLGTAIGYLFTRLDQRSIRARLKNDIKLLEKVSPESAAHESLVALVDREAEQLNRRWLGIEHRLLPRGAWVLGMGIIVYLAAYVARYAAFHYFASSMTSYISYSDGGTYAPTAAANWIVGTTSSLQTLAIAICLLGVAAIGFSFIFQLLRKTSVKSISGHMVLWKTGHEAATDAEAEFRENSD